MKHYFHAAKTYVIERKKAFISGGSIVIAIALIFLGLALYSYNTSQPKVVYEPAIACTLLTPAEAKELLGDAVLNTVSTPPTQTGDIATSKCGYSDGKLDTANAVVIAIIVRSGINDSGIALNKAQFVSGTPTENVEMVKDLGDNAYFNKTLGQLNVLKDSTWILISYGPSANPAANTLEDAVKLAKKIVQ